MAGKGTEDARKQQRAVTIFLKRSSPLFFCTRAFFRAVSGRFAVKPLDGCSESEPSMV
jgi:hypothetical protein